MNWKPVVGFERAYEVSDQGEVRSIGRFVRGAPGAIRWNRGRIRKPVLLNGYPAVCLSLDGHRRLRTIHRMVLEAFVGPQPCGMEACHNNDDRLDARLANLRWDSHRSNIDDRSRNGKTARGEASGTSKFQDSDIIDIRDAHANGVSQVELARRYGCAKGTIHYIVRHVTWTHI